MLFCGSSVNGFRSMIRFGCVAVKPSNNHSNRYRLAGKFALMIWLGSGFFQTAAANPPATAPNPQDAPGYYEDTLEKESDSQFTEKLVGQVSGAKPPDGACMPLKDTPIIPVDTYSSDLNSAFSYFLNLDNREFYNADEGYLGSTFFIGGALGCPDIIKLRTPIADANINNTKIPTLAALNRAKALSCYNYYILNRSTKPWYHLERPSKSGADDPLTMFDPNRSILNNCQPLINGNDAWKIQKARWRTLVERSPDPLVLNYNPDYIDSTGEQYNPLTLEKKKGFAPVLRYTKRADMDEDEYLLSDYLDKAWDQNFVNVVDDEKLDNISGTIPRSTSPANLISLDLTRAPAGQLTNPFKQDPNNQIGLPCSKLTEGDDNGGSCDVDIPPQCGVSVPSYIAYNSQDYNGHPRHQDTLKYCPNVEKINEPSHPFSPRHDVQGAQGFKTDRDYSTLTSQPYVPPPCNGKCGYTDWAFKDNNCNAQDIPKYREKYPAVQCAIVPVDILDFRKEQFDNCIMQRINQNVIEWGGNGTFNLQTGGGWQPPCSTRFWERDKGNCQAKLSIQQCCRIIVKDVVPANFLKMRTAEGLKQKRRKGPNSTYQQDLQGAPLNIRSPRQRFFDSQQSMLQPSGGTSLDSDLAFLEYLSISSARAATGVATPTTPNAIPLPSANPNVPSTTDTSAVDLVPGNTVPTAPPAPTPPPPVQCFNTTPEDEREYDDNVVSITDEDFLFRITRSETPPVPTDPDFVSGSLEAMEQEGAPDRMTEYYKAFMANLVLNKEKLEQREFTEPPEYRFSYYKFNPDHDQLFINPFTYANGDPTEDDPTLALIADSLPSGNGQSYYGSIMGYNMPYMRWWDTGVSAGNRYKGGSFVNTLGGWDVIIGVGREERDLKTAEMLALTSARYCAVDAGRLARDEPSQMGRVGGWAELKAHQMWTTRRNNLSCIGRYEKLFKQGGPENLALSKAGAGYTSMDSKQWPWSLGWRGYASDSHSVARGGHPAKPGWQFPYFPDGNNGPTPYGATGPVPFDLTAVGDMATHGKFDPTRGSDYSGKTQDAAGNPISAIIAKGDPINPVTNPNPKGLDDALPGDIITINMNGMPQVYFVTKLGWPIDINSPESKWDYIRNKYMVNGNPISPDRIFVESWDQGKFPTSTGSSMHWGYGPERVIYKYAVPENYSNQICAKKIRALTDATSVTTNQPLSNFCSRKMKTTPIVHISQADCKTNKCQPSCADTDPTIGACVLPNGITDWKTAKIYRPAYDIRKCPGPITLQSVNSSVLSTTSDIVDSLRQTYKWNAPVDQSKPIMTNTNPNQPRVDSVVFQAQTNEIGTDLFAWCVNAGYDPPRHYAREYKGAQTGALTDTSLCGPTWGGWNLSNLSQPQVSNATDLRGPGCSTSNPEERKCFPSLNPAIIGPVKESQKCFATQPPPATPQTP